MYYHRIIAIAPLLKHTSVILFGPRQTGKSSLLRNELLSVVTKTYNLLDQGILRRFLADPTLLRQELAANILRDRVVCIDEIQEFQALLDVVHLLMEEHGLRFLLTGSSARELRRQGVNMIDGRGRDRTLRSLTVLWRSLGSATPRT